MKGERRRRNISKVEKCTGIYREEKTVRRREERGGGGGGRRRWEKRR